MILRALPFVAALVLTGCSGASLQNGGQYDANRNETFYRSTSVDIGLPTQGGMRGASRVTLSAEATCMGEACVPDEWTLSLSKAGGNTAVADYDQISFETSDGTITFGNDVDAVRSAKFFSTTQGEFVRLSIPTYMFASFAESPSFVVRLGGSLYSVPYDRRGAFRRVLPAAAQ